MLRALLFLLLGGFCAGASLDLKHELIFQQVHPRHAQDQMMPDFGVLSDEEITYVNNMADTTWKAGRNFDQSEASDVIKRLGVKDLKKLIVRAKLSGRRRAPVDDTQPPNVFDPRKKWPFCPSLNYIRDQGNCGSCWAVSVAEAMTDRICIQSLGKTQVNISGDDITTCCYFCGTGCGGGDPEDAWDMFTLNGVVSGGPYNSSQGCKPYEMQPCGRNPGHKYIPCPRTPDKTPACKKECIPAYPKTYGQDKHYGDDPIFLDAESVIMRELFLRGPLQTSFFVYADFLHYKSGVYQHVSGKLLGGHSVKIIGYGVENGTRYWEIANSWNYGWGDKGFFKMRRGVNECAIESAAYSANPAGNPDK